ncbi:MAG TPA: hypothetical protein VGC46_07010, partial [Allosphingosinicella sp.]
MRHLVLTGLAATAAGLAVPGLAIAQTAPLSPADQLCTAAAGMGPEAPAYPTDQALDATAQSVEASLEQLRARGDASSANPAALDLPLVSSQAPAPLALARYCAAAGELMRVSAGGSQRQAQTFLLAAYRLAQASGDPLASRAAYRLALVGASEPGADGTRGASGGRRRGTGPSAPLEERAATPPDSACEELTPAGLDTLTAREVSLLALACAADRAQQSGDLRLAALSNLKLAQLEGNYADLPGEERETFRAFARERAQRAILV